MATKKIPALTEIPDFVGNPVRVGDTVVFIHKYGNSGCSFMFGEVSGISKAFGADCVVLDDGIFKCKPTSQSIMKVDSQLAQKMISALPKEEQSSIYYNFKWNKEGAK